MLHPNQTPAGAVPVDLPWLPQPAPDFQEQLKSLAASDAPGPALQWLATARLSRGQANRIAKALDRCRAARVDLGMPGFKLGVASNSTMDMITDLVPAAGLRHRVAIETISADYGQVFQEAVDPGSILNQAGCDAILLALDYRGLQLDRPQLKGGAAFVDAEAERLRAMVAALKANSAAAVILQTLAQPAESLFGSYDRRVEGSVRWMIDRMNDAILEIAAAGNCTILDVAALAEQVGGAHWFDPVAWNGYKMAFAGDCADIYADWLARLIASIRGQSRKCLVLDLDNTCWGGVIGDDGIDGIRIGQGHPLGEAHLAVQQLALDLHARGVMLAVASKNDDAVARRVFQEHDDMLLKESHIAVFQANWLDKPSNLEAIAKTLNIGIDALVMLDDNPAERAMIRAALPQVAVPELPSDPSQFARILSAAGYFEAVSFSDEDRIRSETYAADAQRAEVLQTFHDLGDYLKSLDMVINLKPFDDKNRPRITQLVNKTNQFNLTTKRYSEAQIESFEKDSGYYTLQVRLRDKFGDLGMIAVVIAEIGGPEMIIDSWLMSCRVLGRNVEQAMLARVVRDALEAGSERIVATYRPTAKNGMVRDLFDRLGFHLQQEDDDGTRHYVLDAAEWTPPHLPMQVEND